VADSAILLLVPGKQDSSEQRYYYFASDEYVSESDFVKADRDVQVRLMREWFYQNYGYPGDEITNKMKKPVTAEFPGLNVCRA
jgi:hypothetical protein